MGYEEKDMSLEDMIKLIKESIKRGNGLISYRKHVQLLFKLERRIEMLSEYRKKLVEDVDSEIHSLDESVVLLRKNIKDAMTDDDSIEKTDTGGKTVNLPDLGVLSLSKEMEKIVITDAQKVMEKLGKQVIKVVETLDKTKAKAILSNMVHPEEGSPSLDGAIIVEGAELEKYRELKVTKKK